MKGKILRAPQCLSDPFSADPYERYLADKETHSYYTFYIDLLKKVRLVFWSSSKKQYSFGYEKDGLCFVKVRDKTGREIRTTTSTTVEELLVTEVFPYDGRNLLIAYDA